MPGVRSLFLNGGNMSKENVSELSRSSCRDNKIVDLCAAVITGLGLFFLKLRMFSTFSFGPPPTYAELLQKVAILVGAFVLSALLFFVWRHPIRAKWGWIPIAIVGLVIMAKINDMIWEATIPEQHREPMFEGLSYMVIYCPYSGRVKTLAFRRRL
jgi:hypothetical protein